MFFNEFDELLIIKLCYKVLDSNISKKIELLLIDYKSNWVFVDFCFVVVVVMFG